ncbi:MAG: hypothetical protein H6R26_1496 [Proteobacteria bacterium]|nr:hypothetical protein [Pseudomonadota bacterium]
MNAWFRSLGKIEPFAREAEDLHTQRRTIPKKANNLSRRKAETAHPAERPIEEFIADDAKPQQGGFFG